MTTLNYNPNLHPYMSEQTNSNTDNDNNNWNSDKMPMNRLGNSLDDNFRDMYNPSTTDFQHNPQRYFGVTDAFQPHHLQDSTKVQMQQIQQQQHVQQVLQYKQFAEPQQQQLSYSPHQHPTPYYHVQNLVQPETVFQLPMSNTITQSQILPIQGNLQAQILLPLQQQQQQQLIRSQYPNPQLLPLQAIEIQDQRSLPSSLMHQVTSSYEDLSSNMTKGKTQYLCPVKGCPWNLRKGTKKSDLRKHCFETHLIKGKISRGIDPSTADLISELSYKCTIENCGKHYSRSDSLKRHIKLIHHRPTSRFNRKRSQQQEMLRRREGGIHGFP